MTLCHNNLSKTTPTLCAQNVRFEVLHKWKMSKGAKLDALENDSLRFQEYLDFDTQKIEMGFLQNEF